MAVAIGLVLSGASGLIHAFALFRANERIGKVEGRFNKRVDALESTIGACATGVLYNKHEAETLREWSEGAFREWSDKVNLRLQELENDEAYLRGKYKQGVLRFEQTVEMVDTRLRHLEKAAGIDPWDHIPEPDMEQGSPR